MFAIDRVVAATGPQLFVDQIVVDSSRSYGVSHPPVLWTLALRRLKLDLRGAFPRIAAATGRHEMPQNYSEWHRWFSWYPVRLSGRQKRVWLRLIERKLGTSGGRKWRYRLSRQDQEEGRPKRNRE